MNPLKITLLGLVLVAVLAGCSTKAENSAIVNPEGKKIGVLLVNHGSRSETWRNALLDLEKSVRDSILIDGTVKGTKTAFMEYTEPSIATRLKEFDAEGYTDVVIVPIFLTVSPHSFEDIPTIIGKKEDPQSLEMLKVEKIERYTPKANTTITPLLDFTDIVRRNVLRRTQALSKTPANEGLVLMAYGDETYVKEWSELLDSTGAYVTRQLGMKAHSWGWCGHIAHYNPDSTTVAIDRVLSKVEKAVVVPVLVAHDEMFQVKIIGDGIAQVDKNNERITYRPDAILPDPNVSHWVIAIAGEYSHKVAKGADI